MWACRVVAVLAAASLLAGDAFPKKKDDKARLKEIEAIFVRGDGPAVEYIERNLGQETCLVRARSEQDADAILEIRQDNRPCRSALSGLCIEITAILTDRQTKKVIWFRTDSEFGSRALVGVDETAGKWVLWNLNGACCKDR
jgi:hypothetical protein